MFKNIGRNSIFVFWFDICDYFFDVLRDEKGIELPVNLLDELEQRLMGLARARFPD